MLSDLAIGWLQEEVLLQMYARFAMQPATIPDVVAGWEQPPGSEEAQSRRRRLTASAVYAGGERQKGQRQRRRHNHTAAAEQKVGDSYIRNSDEGRGNGSIVATAGQGRDDSSRRSGWRYRRRKTADGKRRAGRSLVQLSDVVGQDTAAGTAALDPGWQQSSADSQPHHRRRQRQHQQQEQESRTEAVAAQYSSDELADPSLESLYPELPPPMFEQNAGADARRCCRRLRRTLSCGSITGCVPCHCCLGAQRCSSEQAASAMHTQAIAQVLRRPMILSRSTHRYSHVCSTCWRGEEFRELVPDAGGWEWVDEARPGQNRHKWG